MADLNKHLADLPYHDLRAVATRLKVRRRGEDRKEAWRLAIERAWQDDQQRRVFLAALTPAASGAAQRLVQAQELPTLLFIGEYGPIRRASRREQWQKPPWEQPTTVSEELYYAELLHSKTGEPIERSTRVLVPCDLWPLLTALPKRSLAHPPAPLLLLHDLTQVLIYLQGQTEPPLLRRGTLPARHAAYLKPFLLAMATQAGPDAHQLNHWLRWLLFLIEAAGLAHQGTMGAAGTAC